MTRTGGITTALFRVLSTNKDKTYVRILLTLPVDYDRIRLYGKVPSITLS